jgi:hypothetical protein
MIYTNLLQRLKMSKITCYRPIHKTKKNDMKQKNSSKNVNQKNYNLRSRCYLPLSPEPDLFSTEIIDIDTNLHSTDKIIDIDTNLYSTDKIIDIDTNLHSTDKIIDIDTNLHSTDKIIDIDTNLHSTDKIIDIDTNLHSTDKIIDIDTNLHSTDKIIDIDTNLHSTDKIIDIDTNLIDSSDNTQDMLAQTRESIKNGKNVVKFFQEQPFIFDVDIVPSTCTYWGMTESLAMICDKLTNDCVDISKICVLGPHYYDIKRGPNNHDFKYGDTQACGGGKATKVYDKKKKGWINEPYETAAWNELLEELRISGKTGSMISEYKTESIDTKIRFGYEKVTCTKIYTYSASECNSPVDYDSREFSKKNRRGTDNYMSRVGYIVWGTVDECFTLVNSITTDTPTSPIVEHIDAIVIIPIRNAVKMAEYASVNLKGKIISKVNFLV